MSNSAVLDRLEFIPSEWTDQRGSRIPGAFNSVEDEYWALKEAAGLMDLSGRGKLLVREIGRASCRERV